ncbi:MAG TPA: hypothetical protein VK622_10995, partial [Puia sp.]|nr:hypothetical protein [Puia sp.]
MKIAVLSLVTSAMLEKFSKDKIDTVIFCRLDKTVDYEAFSKQFKLINAFKDTTESNWHNFNLVTSQHRKLRSRLPGIFKYKSYDLEIALSKDMLWAFISRYALLFQAEKLKTSGKEFVFYDDRPLWEKKLALLKKLFFYKHSAYVMQIPADKQGSRDIAFRMNDLFMIDVYGDLFKKMKLQKVISFQTIIAGNADAIDKQMYEVFDVNFRIYPTNENRFRPGFFEKIKLVLMNGDPDFFNALIYSLNCLYNHVDEYEKLFSAGIKKIVINAGENEGEGSVLCDVAKKHDALTFNYMNGAKEKSPQNIETHFDYWFMPDKKTQDLLLSYCNVEEKQLPVVGHLLQEKAEDHSYSGTLDMIMEKLKGKKVIGLFTSKIYVNEKIGVMSFLSDYLEKHPDIVVLVRKHPDELDSKDILNERIIKLPEYPERLFQKSLFDLFLKSDVAISFSSTVSYQASWFGIPSLNFEVAEVSRLSFVDNQKVFHV